jgi:3'(2'), 5'-bisphosphate nucleotidase
VEALWPALVEAGERIRRVAASNDWQVETKSDQSPVTRADRESEAVILEALARLTPTIPVLSEEQESVPPEQRSGWSRFWCLDPLDGTKEFLHRTGEYAINLALIESRYPVFGIIFQPATGQAWFGGENLGAWLIDASGARRVIRARAAGEEVVSLGSRFHAGIEAEVVGRVWGARARHMVVGSSLKFCRLACGEADVYLRGRPTCEWDTAAGQAILEGAGGCVFGLDGHRLAYNKADLRNPGFLALGHGGRWDPAFSAVLASRI